MTTANDAISPVNQIEALAAPAGKACGILVDYRMNPVLCQDDWLVVQGAEGFLTCTGLGVL
jgi:hypothetical protein